MPDFTCLNRVQADRPLIHCISNIVSAGDCANLALAVGAGPIMAQEPKEMREITAASAATVINTGTPSGEKFLACRLAGQEAAALSHPVVLDPVGVGASRYRLSEVEALLEAFSPSVLRVNLGEARALLGEMSGERGVDSLGASSREERLSCALLLAQRRGTVVLLSGREDLATDGKRAFLLSGGSGLMAKVTGTGCMLSVLCGVFAAVCPDPLEASVLASSFWKVCAEKAEQAAGGRGAGSFRTTLFDAASLLTAEEFSRSAQIEAL